MAPNAEESPYFQKKDPSLVLKDPPKFDLESYIANYEGHTRLDRLHLIGTTSTYLSIDAFRMAIAEAKQGTDTRLYLHLTEIFNEIAPQDPAASVDMEWVEKKNRELKGEQERLEHELKAYKNNMIKESIRMGHEDLGQFHYSTGNYPEALKSYARMREHCTTTKHLADLTLRLTHVALTQKAWQAVSAQVAKLESQQMKPEEKAKVEPIVKACRGLAAMSGRNYPLAADLFIKTPPSYITMEPVTGIKWQKEVMTANDLAVYGGLCALASMDRTQLQNNVLSHPEFRTFLELEPHIRRAISLFCSSKYSSCLEILEGYRTDYLLDPYLAPILREIYSSIRTKCIVQYFIPFSCVTLDEMEKKFGTVGGLPIESELLQMITAGVLDARIDLVDRLLVAPPINPRLTVQAETLAMAENYEHTLRLRLTRLSMLNAGLDIRKEKGENQQGGASFGEGVGSAFKGLGTRLGF